MRPESRSKPPLSSATSPSSPVHDALGLSPDTLRGAPSLQPGTAKEERERRLQATSHHRKAELSEALRRVDASKDGLSTDRPADGASRTAKEQSRPKHIRRDHDRSSTSSSQATIQNKEVVTVRCTTTPLDWPHPNSAAVPRFPPLTPSSRALNVKPSNSTVPTCEHPPADPPTQAYPSLAPPASDMNVRPAEEMQGSSSDELASALPLSATSVNNSSHNAGQRAIAPSKTTKLSDLAFQAKCRKFHEGMQNRGPFTRKVIHEGWLAKGTVQLCDVERVTLKTPVPQPSKPPMIASMTTASKTGDEQNGLPPGCPVEDGSSVRAKESVLAPSALPKSTSCRSTGPAATTATHDGSASRIVASVLMKGGKTEVVKDVASGNATSRHANRPISKGSQPPQTASGNDAGGTNGGPKNSITRSERTVDTSKSVSSGASRAVESDISERDSLEKSRSPSNLLHRGSVHGRPSATPQENTSSSAKVRSDQPPQVNSSGATRAIPPAVRAQETVSRKTTREKVAPNKKTARAGSSVSAASTIGTSSGVAGAQDMRSNVVASKVESHSTRPTGSRVTKVPPSTTSEAQTTFSNPCSPQPTTVASPSKPPSGLRQAPSVRQQGKSTPKQAIVPSKVEKPKSLAAFAEDMQTKGSEDHQADADVGTYDPLTPLARFFTASIVGSTVGADDDFGSTVEDSPFGKAHLPFATSAIGPDVWKSASLTEVNAMKPHFSHSPSRNSLAGLIFADTDDAVEVHLDATSSEGSLPPAESRRSRATSNVHVMAFPNASGSTVSVTDDHVMSTDPGFPPSEAPRAVKPFLLREHRPAGAPPPRYSSLTNPAVPPPSTVEKGRIIPPQPWLMGDRMPGREVDLRPLPVSPLPGPLVRHSAEIRKGKWQKKVLKAARLEGELEQKKRNGNFLQKTYATARLMAMPAYHKKPLPEPRSSFNHTTPSPLRRDASGSS